MKKIELTSCEKVKKANLKETHFNGALIYDSTETLKGNVDDYDVKKYAYKNL